jgi:hypothetical protein
MSLLGDIMGEAIFSGVGGLIAELPPRVRHTLTGLAGVSLAAGVGGVIAAWPTAGDRPGWTIGLIVISLVYGLVLAAVSAVTLVNDPHDRPFALFALLACCAAAALPMTAVTL